ncbi:MAG: hypothetical protein EHM87_24730 [Burkholderiales bacterium]|nr:MAG: hypothetical protein EHM87_24730 [Burkholderiales bacterium]
MVKRMQILCLVLSLLGSGEVLAHKVKLFAVVEGEMVKGYAYFVGGGPVVKGSVQVKTAAGQVIGEVVTDGSGQFLYPKGEQPVYVFELVTADGHRADYEVSFVSSRVDVERVAKSEGVISGVESRYCQEELGRLGQQIAELQVQLNGYEDKVRWHDVLGGIGYILGIMGVIGYLKGRQ